jgi:hypothetical protein
MIDWPLLREGRNIVVFEVVPAILETVAASCLLLLVLVETQQDDASTWKHDYTDKDPQGRLVAVKRAGTLLSNIHLVGENAASVTCSKIKHLASLL